MQWKNDNLFVYMHEGYNIPAIPIAFDPYLYLTSEHLLTQTSNNIYSFFLFRANETKAAAIFQCVYSNDKNWLSPPRAPFGGIQCDDKCVTNEVNFLLQCVDQFTLSHGLGKIIISTASSCYNLNMSNLLSDCYQTNGYNEVKRYLNHSITITPAIYAEFIHGSEKRRLKKCKRAGLVAELYANPDIDLAFNFLQFCRSEKGYNISLTISQLKELFARFPEKVTVFTVKHQNNIVALTITIRVNESIMYNFLSANLCSYNEYSPTVLLTEAVYVFCQDQKISILDLGTSLNNLGKEKAGLIRFKKNIGGTESYKITYEKVLKLSDSEAIPIPVEQSAATFTADNG